MTTHRRFNRLRSLLAGIFPALERVLDFTNRGPLILISGFQTPTTIRQLGAGRLDGMAEAATSASLIVRLAQTVLHDGKRAQGKRHTPAVLALARRRVNVLWAMLRDHRPYQEQPPKHVLHA